MSVAAVAHDGTTPRKTNRSNSSAMMIIPSTTATTIRSRNFDSLANSLPYINNHHETETPRNSTTTRQQQRTIIPRPIIMIEINNDDAPAVVDDEHSFVMHRKLLRRRHVRKVQKEQRLRRQREVDSRKRRNTTVEELIPSINRPVNSFSELDGSIEDSSTCSSYNNNASTGGGASCSTTIGQTVNHIAMIRNTICSSARGVMIEHNDNSKDTGVNKKNVGSAFISTPLLYSPLRSTKRRRLFVSNTCC